MFLFTEIITLLKPILVGVNNFGIDVQSTGNVVTPVSITSSDWNNLNADMACRLVKFDKLTVIGGKDDENTDAYTIYTVTPDGVRVNIRIDADVAIKVNSIMKNKTWETFKDCTFLNVVGIVQPYYENYQLMVMNLNDLGYQKSATIRLVHEDKYLTIVSVN